MKNTTKQIAYSYPTSINARKQASLYSKGCYSVETVTNGKPPKFLKGFETLEEAKKYADTLEYTYNKYCLTQYQK